MGADRYLRYYLRYRVATPVRIGHRKVGNLQTTRLYIPGIASWASAVRRFVSRFDSSAPKGSDEPFRRWGGILKRICRFSCLFIEDWEDGGRRFLLPGDPEERRARIRIEKEYLFSTVLTAIDHGDNVAEEGSLHELEWLSPKGRSGSTARVWGWVDVPLSVVGRKDETGVTLQRSDCGDVLVEWNGSGALLFGDLLSQATVGADVGHFQGCLCLEEKEGGYEVPDRFDFSGNEPVPGEVVVWGSACTSPSGRVEAYVGRETRGLRPGAFLTPHYFAYEPGARARGKFFMDWRGRFRASKPDPESFSLSAGKNPGGMDPGNELAGKPFEK